jgi:hypothetical protein
MKVIYKKVQNAFTPFPALAFNWRKDANNTRRYEVELLFLIWYISIEL